MGRVRVFIACSLDGFIAGEDDDLSWLPPPPPPEEGGGDFGYAAFMSEVGALLMGRNTYRIVEAFTGDWMYGDKPVLVATTTPLTPKVPTVRAVAGDIAALVSEALAVAGDKDVYLDGGVLIRQGLDAGLVDELVVSYVPVVLGKGAPLFAGVASRHAFELVHTVAYGTLLQVTLRPKRV